MRPVMIKIGGGLLALSGALERVCHAVAKAGERHPVLVVPGGGPFADAVRAFERAHGLSADAAHWMALLAMDQYAHVLAERIPGAQLVGGPGSATEALRTPGVVVLAPARWMRAADVLPHTWEASSDSVAAFVAGALEARHLVLVKPVGGPAERLVDGYFRSALPADLTVLTLVPDQLADWEGLLDDAKDAAQQPGS